MSMIPASAIGQDKSSTQERVKWSRKFLRCLSFNAVLGREDTRSITSSVASVRKDRQMSVHIVRLCLYVAGQGIDSQQIADGFC